MPVCLGLERGQSELLAQEREATYMFLTNPERFSVISLFFFLCFFHKVHGSMILASRIRPSCRDFSKNETTQFENRFCKD